MAIFPDQIEFSAEISLPDKEASEESSGAVNRRARTVQTSIT
jgi:hypothetical protein